MSKPSQRSSCQDLGLRLQKEKTVLMKEEHQEDKPSHLRGALKLRWTEVLSKAVSLTEYRRKRNTISDNGRSYLLQEALAP